MADEVKITGAYEDAGADAGLEGLAERADVLDEKIRQLSRIGVDLGLEGEAAKAGELAREVARLERSFDAAARRARDAQKAFDLDQSSANAKKLERALKDVNTRGQQLVDTADELGNRLPRGARLSADQMDRLRAATARARTQLEGLGNVARGGAFDRLVTGVRGAATALRGLVVLEVINFLGRVLNLLVRVGTQSIQVAAEIGRVEPALRGLTGSSDVAAESLEFLQKVSRDLKVAVGDLAPSYINLQGAVAGTGIRLREVDTIFRAVVESGRAFGQSTANISLALQAVSQLAGKGVASMEELRRQLAERIPNAIPALALGLGVTIPEAIAKVSSGSLKSADALRALASGLDQLNSAAAQNQLDTLTGSLSELDRVSERARQLFGEGLAPAVVDLANFVGQLVDENEELIRQLGAGLGQALQQTVSLFQFWVRQINDARETIRESEGLTRAFTAALQGLGTVLPGITGENFTEIRNALLGIGDVAKEEFDKVTDAATAAANDGETSAKAILDNYVDAFQEAAREAGISNEEIAESSRNLADELARISEETAERRAELQKVVEEAAEKGRDEAVAAAERLRSQLVAIEEDIAEQRRAAIEATLENARRADEQRIESERTAQAERLRLIDEATARETSAREQSLAGLSQEAAERVKLEQEAARKIEEARQDGAQRLAKATKATAEERQEIIQDTAEKIAGIEAQLTERLERLEERRAQAAEKAAERRRKAEEKARQELEKALVKLSEFGDKLDDIAGGEEEGVLARIKDQFQGIRSTLEGLGTSLDVLRGGLQGGAEGFDFFAESTDTIRSALNLADSAAGSFQNQIEGTATATESAGTNSKALASALGAARGALEALGGASPEVRGEIIRIVTELERLAEGGNVSAQDIQALGVQLQNAVEIGFDAISRSDVTEKLRDVGEAAQEAATETESAGKRTAVAFDETTKTLVSVPNAAQEAASGVATAATEMAESLDSVGESAGDIGEQLTTGLSSVTETVSGIQEKIQQLGQPIPIDGFLTSVAQIETALIGLSARVDATREKLDNLGAAPGEASAPQGG